MEPTNHLERKMIIQTSMITVYSMLVFRGVLLSEDCNKQALVHHVLMVEDWPS